MLFVVCARVWCMCVWACVCMRGMVCGGCSGGSIAIINEHAFRVHRHVGACVCAKHSGTLCTNHFIYLVDSSSKVCCLKACRQKGLQQTIIINRTIKLIAIVIVVGCLKYAIEVESLNNLVCLWINRLRFHEHSLCSVLHDNTQLTRRGEAQDKKKARKKFADIFLQVTCAVEI